VKIAVPSTPPGGLKALVDPRVGRCQVFTIVEVENGKIKDVKVVQNTAAYAFGGAGIQAVQLLINHGVNVIIGGNIGPNAYMAMQQAGIQFIGGVMNITVEEAVKLYLEGKLKPTGMPPWGPGPGIGFGRGMGRGMGRGYGRWGRQF